MMSFLTYVDLIGFVIATLIACTPLVLAAMGMLLSQTLKILERRLARWKRSQTQL